MHTFHSLVACRRLVPFDACLGVREVVVGPPRPPQLGLEILRAELKHVELVGEGHLHAHV